MGFFRRLFARSSAERKSGANTSQSNEKAGLKASGRRLREDVPYALPKDLEEGQRLNLQHYVFRYFLHGNYAAPLPETITSVLDVGSGTGIWGQEMAAQFPGARIFGLDLEPPQSVSLSAQVVRPPANYHFVQGNVLEGLPFPDNTFDYTHQRMLVLALPPQHWYKAIVELARVTRPGGWVELLEIGGFEFHPVGPASKQLIIWMTASLEARGFDLNIMQRLGDMLTTAGLHSVTSQALEIPLGAWDSRLGILLEKDVVAVFSILKPGACKLANIPTERFDQYVQEAVKEWKHMRAHYRFYLAYGQVGR